MQLSYYKDSTPRGEAGCARDAGLDAGSDTLVIVDGTAIPTVDLAALLAAHLASGAVMTAVVHREEMAAPTPGGVYVVERRALGQVPENGFQDIKENLIPRLYRAGARVAAHESDACCPHVFNAQTYLAVSQWMLQRIADAEVGGDGLVDPTASVEPGVRFVGPVQIGAGAHIAAGATVVGPTTIGPDCVVGRNALVARSVLWSRCTVGEGAVVHGCVAGNDAALPPAARLFNAVHAASPLRARVPAPRPRDGGHAGGAHAAAPIQIPARLG